MTPLLTGALLFAMAGVTGPSQSSQSPASEQQVDTVPEADRHLNKSEVVRLIAFDETSARGGEASQIDRKRLVLIYSTLGTLYEDAGMFLKAADVIRRATTL